MRFTIEYERRGPAIVAVMYDTVLDVTITARGRTRYDARRRVFDNWRLWFGQPRAA